MPVEPDLSGSSPEVLSHLFQHDSDPVAIVGGLARVLRDIEKVLTPILGTRGVAALYQRSLHVTRASHAWLADPAEAAQPTLDLQALETTFARQRGDHAAAANALLQSFHELLTSLIGRPLTERLLAPVWERAPDGTDSQDTSP